MDFASLNGYSRRFAAFLLATFPEWQASVAVDTRAGIDAGSLLVQRFPDPPRDIQWPLQLSTDNEEITVSFDFYHAHFTAYDDQEESTFTEALDFVAAFLAERIVVVSWWDGDQWRGSAHFPSGTERLLPETIRGAKTARIRSWRGTYDRDENVRANDP